IIQIYVIRYSYTFMSWIYKTPFSVSYTFAGRFQ
ncbi:hypothetical protein M145_3092, partial [Bacteroides fragilis str. 34-F-2 